MLPPSLILFLFAATIENGAGTGWTLYPPAKWFRESLMWEKLSNSGDALKLLVPNLEWKFGGGRSNYSYKVTSQKMTHRLLVLTSKLGWKNFIFSGENEMGYRGSKSKGLHSFVKEQRVDGSYINSYLTQSGSIKNTMLRCTLMGFERSYPVKTLSSLINKRFYCSSLTVQNTNSKLNPWTVTGFSDGESSFMVRVRKNSKYKTGWLVAAIFSIVAHKKDLLLLEAIKEFFGGLGSIKKNGNSTFSYRIESSEQIIKIILPFFDKYPLMTEKLGDYLLFKKVIELMNTKEHLTQQGLEKIVSLKASINKGLSEELQAAFPQCITIPRPVVNKKIVPNAEWLAGFASAEGCFKSILRKSLSVKVGYQSILVFQITQHARDEKLMQSLITYLDCGIIEKDSRGPWLYYTVANFSHIRDKIIPFFHQYKIIGCKNIDFRDWCKIATLMQDKKHLTPEGLNDIIGIKAGMNKARFKSED